MCTVTRRECMQLSCNAPGALTHVLLHLASFHQVDTEQQISLTWKATKYTVVSSSLSHSHPAAFGMRVCCSHHTRPNLHNQHYHAAGLSPDGHHCTMHQICLVFSPIRRNSTPQNVLSSNSSILVPLHTVAKLHVLGKQSWPTTPKHTAAAQGR